jgi:phosphoribosylamine--glycine ligase
MKNILLIGSGAREHAIARAIVRSAELSNLYCFGATVNPGIKQLCEDYQTGNICDIAEIAGFIAKENIDFAIVGPEAPLEKGIADALWAMGIPVIGPKQCLAQIETSKGFTRDLLKKYNIPGGPAYQSFTTLEGVADFLATWPSRYVIKADGLMGGKGVKVFGDHLQTDAEALAFCRSLVGQGLSFVLEEKLVGEEFSLISFSDGEHVVHTPVIQDHKRAFVGDVGPNTGGMGSYSDANHRLPFITQNDVAVAARLNESTIKALRAEYGEKYIGFLYGGFMATAKGVQLIEYNARLGDPEAMNILSILTSDFLEACLAMIQGELTPSHLQFAVKATVCKYAVPMGYPEDAVRGQLIDISNVHNKEQVYLAAVDETDDGLIETGSRTVAVVGIADTIADAEKIAEAEINRIQGPLFHREDIGTQALLSKRIVHMESLRTRVLS